MPVEEESRFLQGVPQGRRLTLRSGRYSPRRIVLVGPLCCGFSYCIRPRPFFGGAIVVLVRNIRSRTYSRSRCIRQREHGAPRGSSAGRLARRDDPAWEAVESGPVLGRNDAARWLEKRGQRRDAALMRLTGSTQLRRAPAIHTPQRRENAGRQGGRRTRRVRRASSSSRGDPDDDPAPGRAGLPELRVIAADDLFTQRVAG